MTVKGVDLELERERKKDCKRSEEEIGPVYLWWNNNNNTGMYWIVTSRKQNVTSFQITLVIPPSIAMTFTSVRIFTMTTRVEGGLRGKGGGGGRW